MKQQFDLVVLGTGSAGSTVARACRAAGWRVAIVDSRPFGGTCAMRGCDPKKMLVGAAELVDWSRRMRAKGVVTSGLQISWPALMAFKRSFTDQVPRQREAAFKEAGIVGIHGQARFVGRSSVAVGDDILEARYAVIATGAKPALLGIEGETDLLTSDRFLDLAELPERLVFIGGGYISFEFAHIAARAGAHARILHRGSRPLPRFDPDLVARLVNASRAAGIDVHLNTRVDGIERHGERVVLRAIELGREVRFEADVAIHGAGRVPDVDKLDLGAAEVARSTGGVEVNEYLQSTTNPAVYAAGDAASGGGLPLTPVAGTEGEIVAENLLKGNYRRADFAGLASAVYTIPPLASVGLDEAQARGCGLKYHVNQGDTAGWYSSRRLAADASAYKVLIEQDTDRILGAHILGPAAEEQINVLALAMRAGIRASDVKNVLFAYPSFSSDLEYMV